MEHTDDTRELESAVEGILFASGEPVQTERICLALSLEREEVEAILHRLRDYYAFERRGMRLLQLEDRWQLCSSPDHAEVIRKAFEIRKPAKLSQPALEALTIIAYYQPTTRAYVDKLRGVDSAYTVGLLLERGLIETCGNLQAPGRPLLYRTTEKFLRSFHISGLDELPPLNEDDIPPQQLRIEDMAQRLTEADSVTKEEAEAVTEAVPEGVTGEEAAPEADAEIVTESEPEDISEVETAVPEEPETASEPEDITEPEADDVPEAPRELLSAYPRILTARPVSTARPARRKPSPRKVYRFAGAFRTRRKRPGHRFRKRRKIARPRHAPDSHQPESIPAPEIRETEAFPPAEVREAEASPVRESRTPDSVPGNHRKVSGKAMRRCFRCLLCGCWLAWPFC